MRILLNKRLLPNLGLTFQVKAVSCKFNHCKLHPKANSYLKKHTYKANDHILYCFIFSVPLFAVSLSICNASSQKASLTVGWLLCPRTQKGPAEAGRGLDNRFTLTHPDQDKKKECEVSKGQKRTGQGPNSKSASFQTHLQSEACVWAAGLCQSPVPSESIYQHPPQGGVSLLWDFTLPLLRGEALDTGST